MSAHSSQKARRRKAAADRPKKPYPDYPLYPHPLGYWSKKVNGTIRNFGRWGRVVNGELTRLEGDGWKEALELFQAQRDDLYAGRAPKVKRGGDGKLIDANADLTVVGLCNAFLTAKLRQREASEIGARMFEEYKAGTDLLVKAFGKDRRLDDLAAGDFEKLRETMAERWGPVRLGNTIGRVKAVFKYGYEAGLLDKPVRYGPQFKKPSAGVLRRHKAQNGERLFDAPELRKLMEAAPAPLKAMVLLGINAAFGNHDIATLPLTALDLDQGFVAYARPKTGCNRRAALWPETIAALREALAARPEPRQDDAKPLAFVTTRGRPWLSRGIANPVSIAVRKLMTTLGIHRQGVGFYSLRHTFRTVADATRDVNAIRLVMGHADASIDANYTHGIDDARLAAVAEHVRQWLWPKPVEQEPAKDAPVKARRKPEARQTERIERPRLRLFAG